MYQFTNDYCTLCTKEVMEELKKNIDYQYRGYGLDEETEKASNLILDKFGLPNGKVYLLSGGTQTNMTIISFLLKSFEAVIACETGHINVHETGAVEASGHKIITVKGADGKVTKEEIEEVMKNHQDPHKVKIKMVYISNSTEIGTIYTKEELKSIRSVCDKYGLYLFIDGARLSVALTSKDNDANPSLIGEVADVFYVGGTKIGLMFGEAAVFKDKTLAQDFNYHIKTKGALLAKGFVLGIQFRTLFTNDLYFTLAKNANETAYYIYNKLKEIVNFYYPVSTNQLFIEVNNSLAHKLIQNFGLELWEDLKDTKVLRIVTSFITTLTDCDELVEFIKNNN